jgi:hypothetical protein
MIEEMGSQREVLTKESMVEGKSGRRKRKSEGRAVMASFPLMYLS